MHIPGIKYQWQHGVTLRSLKMQFLISNNQTNHR